MSMLLMHGVDMGEVTQFPHINTFQGRDIESLGNKTNSAYSLLRFSETNLQITQTEK